MTVQDATWYPPSRSDPYVAEVSEYFPEYTFEDTCRDHEVHGLFADGSRTDNRQYSLRSVRQCISRLSNSFMAN